jgi:acetoin utilization deacetylase AcuC-like enzyme
MAAAVHVRHAGLANRILILDFDQHNGNGTQDIIEHLGLDWATHITYSKSYVTAGQALNQASRVIMDKPSRYYDLVLFQAGADIHVNDPLGGIMTTRQMRMRDELVFTAGIMRDVPIVWNLAGGYNKAPDGSISPVLDLHRQTMNQCINASSTLGYRDVNC